MPTPSTDDDNSAPDQLLHNSCPPVDERPSWRSPDMNDASGALISAATEALQESTPPLPDSQTAHPTERHMQNEQDEQEEQDERSVKLTDREEETVGPDMLSPISTDGDKHEDGELPALNSTDLGSPSMGYDFSNARLLPTSFSPFLRAGSRFHGTQQSEHHVYQVQVEIKHIDMRESFLCGYLQIRGLTETHPTLTTYFEGEIIGSKYSFLTRHQDWGASDKVDLTHWAKFSAFRPFQKQARKGSFQIPGATQRENIFMRWKERFLVPDHRVRTISGASFEGFYYICFNQIHGKVNGIYFHSKSEKFQQLELNHVEDRGCFPAVEFR